MILSPPSGFPVKAVALAGILCFLFLGLFYSSFTYMVTLWNGDEYTYCYMIPFVACYTAWGRRSAIPSAPSPSRTGFLPLAAGIALYWLGELSGEYYTLFISSWLILVGLCWTQLGWESIRQMGFPFLVLFAMFPLPNFLYVNLSVKLQLISSWLGVFILQLLGYTAYREGNVIDLSICKLQVVDACNGLRYLIPLVIMGLVLAHFLKVSTWKKVLLIISTVPLAILLNGLRIALTGAATNIWGTGVTEGFVHDFSGWIMFMISLALLVGVARLLGGRGFLFPPEDSGEDTGHTEEAFAPPLTEENKPARSRRFSGTVYACIAILLLAGTLALSHGVDFHRATPLKKPFSEFPLVLGDWRGNLQSLDEDLVKRMNISDYLLADYRDADSNFVNFYVAYYETQSKKKSIHTPATCLPGGGWVFKETGTISVPTPGHGNGSIVISRAQMQKDGLDQIVYYWFPQRGRVLTDLYRLKLYAFWDALTLRRLDGALVRLIEPVGKYEPPEHAEARLQEFLRLVLPQLDKFIPGKESDPHIQ